MRIATILGVLLGLLGCSSRTGIKKAGVDASPEAASETGAPTTDMARTADGNAAVDLRADAQAGPRETPAGGSFELRQDTSRVVAADAGQCSPGFVRTWALQFPAGAKTVKVIPISAVQSFPMEGDLSDTPGPILHYALKDDAGELLVWRQDDAWFAQLTVSSSGPEAGCIRGQLVAPAPM